MVLNPDVIKQESSVHLKEHFQYRKPICDTIGLIELICMILEIIHSVETCDYILIFLSH